MSKTLQYNKNSILYLRWDQAQYIYLISEGVVVLSADNSNPVSKTKYTKGDFVGLYSALGKFPYQEDAVTHTDVEVMLFSVSEFESLVANKSSFSIQLLQMLSKELRNTHKKAKQILTDNIERVDKVNGLLSYVTLYLETKEFVKAQYVIQTFLRLYPDHSRALELKEKLIEIETLMNEGKK